jgi:hypothetical protein
MKAMQLFAAAIAVCLCFVFAVAQEGGDERKTESRDDAEAGDARAERLLKRAYTRVTSAEAAGLKKLMANANIEVDLSPMGMGAMQFAGELWWESGKPAKWKSIEDEGGGNRNPLAQLSGVAQQVFEPYLAFVVGFDAWDVRFKDARFELLEPTEDEEHGKRDHVKVTYKDEREEIFTVARNSVLSFTRDGEIDLAGEKQKVHVTFSFEYEDQGTKLRPKKITASTEIDVPDLPGQDDPKRPGERSAADTLQGSISVERWGKAGEYEIAIELKGTVGLKSLGMEFPVTLKISEPKINDEVKEAAAPGSEPEGEEF